MASIPHIRFPFNVNGGVLDTVEQDSNEDVVQCVQVLVSTVLGERVEIPYYGVEDPTFTDGINLDEIRRAVDEWEPRATTEIDSEFDEMIEAVTLNVGVRR